MEGVVIVPRQGFDGAFRGRRVLVTGHTGFKGSWLSRWLLDLGADVCGLALAPDTTPSLFDDLGLSEHLDHRVVDVRDAAGVARVVRDFRPEVVLHLAAQPLVRRSYREPADTFAVNVAGTVNLLEALRGDVAARAVVNVTTDKVYENPETGHPFAESEPLGGHDPYSASKACSEIVTASYRASFFATGAAVATARAGNVIGGGDWAEDRLIPDCVRALSRGEKVVLRNPGSVRPWQHVLEPLSGYLHLAAALWREGDAYAQAWNFGPEPDGTCPVSDVVGRFVSAWGSGEWETSDSGVHPHEAGLLRLDITKARERLGWRPLWDIDETVDRTAAWYRGYAAGRSAAELVEADLAAYEHAAAVAGAPWAAA